jgi:16S rRNA (guanine1516-N2)-methyltransferase
MLNYVLTPTAAGLGLSKVDDPAFTPFILDFTRGKIAYRAQHASLRNEPLARALGCKPQTQPFIVDATAGLGRDSFILATLGFNVTLLERSPVLYALLQDALTRANTLPACQRLHLIQADAIEWLQTLTAPPQAVYLDPMFPQRHKSASSKKEMVILQDLLGKAVDDDILFSVAFACAAQRVVVKRPRLAVNIANKVPTFSITGRSSRFDVYCK